VSNAREFNDILDECLEQLLAGDATVEQCLERYPAYAAELEPLLQTTLTAREALAIDPGEELRARARYRLRAEMDRVTVRRWWSVLNWQPRWAVAVVAVLAVLLASGSTVLAADSSMPGSPLYPVKLATENVRLALTSSDVARAELCAALANRRIAEMAYAIERGKARQVERAAERLNAHLAMMSRLSLGEGPAQPTAEEAAPSEEKTAGEVPAEKESPEKPSAAAEGPSAVAQEAPGRAAEAPAESAAGQAARERLTALLGEYAVSHPAKLRALAEDAPESARPAIERAIEASVAGYERALDELGSRSAGPQSENSRSEGKGRR